MKTFALKFRDGRYFITSSEDPQLTMREFALGGYDPITVESIIENAESYHEWALFRDYLCLYGVSRVRSAAYPSWDLTDIQKSTLSDFIEQWCSSEMDQLSEAFDKVSVETCCNRCNAIHEVNLCYSTHDINGDLIAD